MSGVAPRDSLESRVDGLDAAVGQLRARVDALERNVAALIHNTNNHERAIHVLNEQLLDLSTSVVLK